MHEILGSKVILPISECVPGMTLLQPISDIDTGNIIINKGYELTEEVIEKVKQFKHTEIWVEVTTENKKWNVKKETIEKYLRYADALRKVIGKFEKDTQIAITEIKELAQSISSNFNYDFELLACVNLMRNLHKDIYIHSMNVTFLSVLAARWWGLKNISLEKVILASLLHDIGKLQLSDKTFHYRKDFTLEETLEFRKHPLYGYDIIKDYAEIDREVVQAVLSHHERCDGTGFPLNLSGDNITPIARIIGIANEYELLRSQYHIFDIVRILRGEYLKKFDMEMLMKFCSNVINYYIGTYVMLSTGEKAEVVFIHPHCLHRPIVKIGDVCLDLYNKPEIKIEKVL